jgi:3-oxoadipate enol-lactonase
VNARLVTDAPLAHLAWGEAANARIAILLHGVGGGREGWRSTGAALAAAGWRVLAADQPGYGLSGSIQPYDLVGMARAVQQLIEWAGKTLGAPPALVVGHSMGGMVAQELHAAAPQCVRGLVLASTSPAFGSKAGDWQTQFLQSRFAPLDAGVGMAGLAAQLVPAMWGSASTSVAASTDPSVAADSVASFAHAAAQSAATALMAGVPEATYRAAVSALVAFDRRAALAQITVPTLVITGEEDRTAAPEVARRMAEKIAAAELALLPHTGHLLMLEQPQAFDAALLDFVQRRFPEVQS